MSGSGSRHWDTNSFWKLERGRTRTPFEHSTVLRLLGLGEFFRILWWSLEGLAFPRNKHSIIFQMLRKWQEQQEPPSWWPKFARTMETDWGPAPAKRGRHSCSASWLTLNYDTAQILLYWNTVNFFFFFAFKTSLINSASEHLPTFVLMCRPHYLWVLHYAFQPLSPLLETHTKVLADRLESCLFQSRHNP